MERIEVNVITGQVTVIQLTPQEIADAQARTVAEISNRHPEPTKAELLAQIQALTAKVEALP